MSADAGTEGNGESESHDVLEDLELVFARIISTHADGLKVRSATCQIILISLEVEAAENLQTLVEELAIEDEPHQPEPPILL